MSKGYNNSFRSTPSAKWLWKTWGTQAFSKQDWSLHWTLSYQTKATGVLWTQATVFFQAQFSSLHFKPFGLMCVFPLWPFCCLKPGLLLSVVLHTIWNVFLALIWVYLAILSFGSLCFRFMHNILKSTVLPCRCNAGKDPDAGKDWRKRKRGQQKVRQYHRLNGHESEQTPGDSGGQRSLACCSSWGCKESDMT